MSLPASPPADLPRWADGASGHAASVTEPTELLKDTGWVGSNPPPAAVMNWLQNLAYQWIDWINDALTELDSSKQEIDENIEFSTDTKFIGDSTNRPTIFAKGLSVGSGGLETLSAMRVFGHLKPNVAGNDLGEAGLEWDAFLRNVAVNGTFTLTGNFIPGANGNDLGASAGNKWDAFLRNVEVSGTFTPQTIDGNIIPDVNGRDIGTASLQYDAFLRNVELSGDVDLTMANTAAATSIVNQLKKELVPKAWCTIDWNQGTGIATYIDGGNVTSVAWAANVLTITIAGNMLNGAYAAHVTVDDGGTLPALTKAAGTLELAVNAARATTRYNVTIMGRQT